MSDNLVCPYCYCSMTWIVKTESYQVGEVRVPVEWEYYLCPECGEEFDFQSGSDPFAEAYRKYKEMTGKEWRGNK